MLDFEKVKTLYPTCKKLYGPYIGKDGRKRVVLACEDKKFKTKQFARLLYETLLARTLLPEETIDHIDNNFTNDDINNLQILSREANAAKSAPEPERIDAICPKCDIKFMVIIP